MGYFAGSVDGDDAAPVEDFSLPPSAATPRGSLTGTVTDDATGDPIAGATVTFGGLSSGLGDDYAATTDAEGGYTITGIIPGTYPKVTVRAPGYDPRTRTVSIASREQTVDWSVRRDWAAASGGGRIASFVGPDFTPYGCGPTGLIDQSQGQGWVNVSPLSPSPGTQPKSAVIELPTAVDVSEIVVNPANNCGVAGSASTGDYRLETSPDGTTWTVADAGHFGPNDRHPVSVPLASGSTSEVRYVRWTMLSPQVADIGGSCPGAYDGCDYIASTEVAVYGAATPPV